MNWIDIVYLFDIRIIESKIFLDAARNQFGSEQAQPQDALFKVDQAVPMSIFPPDRLKPYNTPFIKSVYFDQLHQVKHSINGKSEKVESLRSKLAQRIDQIKNEKKTKENYRQPTLIIHHDDFLLRQRQYFTNYQEFQKQHNINHLQWKVKPMDTWQIKKFKQYMQQHDKYAAKNVKSISRSTNAIVQPAKINSLMALKHDDQF